MQRDGERLLKHQQLETLTFLQSVVSAVCVAHTRMAADESAAEVVNECIEAVAQQAKKDFQAQKSQDKLTWSNKGVPRVGCWLGSLLWPILVV